MAPVVGLTGGGRVVKVSSQARHVNSDYSGKDCREEARQILAIMGMALWQKQANPWLQLGIDPRLQDGAWVRGVSRQLAASTRVMHDHHFTHNDLKWRNLLVNEKAELFFIDCPTGSFWWGPLLRYRIVKDLACLDKVAKRVLSRTQRLRFYLQYRGRDRLGARDKRRLRQVLKFFEGRE